METTIMGLYRVQGSFRKKQSPIMRFYSLGCARGSLLLRITGTRLIETPTLSMRMVDKIPAKS